MLGTCLVKHYSGILKKKNDDIVVHQAVLFLRKTPPFWKIEVNENG